MEPDTNRSQSAQTGVLRVGPISIPLSDLEMTYVRSTGPGGQNVNKRSTKAQLRVALEALQLDDAAMVRLRRIARSAINAQDELILTSDETRSQSRNRKACLDRLQELIVRSMIVPKERRKTKPTKGSIQRRLDAKKQRSETKQRRRPPEDS